MSKPEVKVAITGACGQIAYNLIFRIANGDMFGKDQKVSLHLLDLPMSFDTIMKGLLMELEDCCFPLLKDIKIGTYPEEVFEGVNYALLIGAKPRTMGMERSDLLLQNAKIFAHQGKALNDHADRDVKVFVVGNPCNTNCLIAMHNAKDLKRENFHAMTRLDENRAKYQLAKRANVKVEDVSNVAIWGNHSATQVADFYNAKINNSKVTDVISDIDWLKDDFFTKIQNRGSEIIKARGKSSAASAAQALIDDVKSILTKTDNNDWFSSAVCTDKNPYGIKNNLVFSFPCVSDGDGNYRIVSGLKWDDFIENKIKITEDELIKERDQVADVLQSKIGASS